MSERILQDMHDAAAAWVARMDGGDWSQADELELETWLARDRRHSGALLQAQAGWIALGVPAGEARPAARTTIELPRRAILVGGMTAIAASLAGGLFWMQSATTYRTELGEIRKLPLADGSSATINSASEVRIRLGKRHRTVTLARGEAWFRVAKDASRPFTVEAGNVAVQAVGTAFSVRRRGAGADVLVTEGVVEAWSATETRTRVRLAAGQRAYIGDDASVKLAPASPSAVDRALAWREGDIDLDGETLADAIEEFNRYNPRKLLLADPALTAERFDGTFRTDDPDGFAAAVASSFGASIDRTDPAVILIGRKKSSDGGRIYRAGVSYLPRQ